MISTRRVDHLLILVDHCCSHLLIKMNGKFVLCIAVVLVGQAMSASLFDGEELKKIVEQFSQSSLSVSQHVSELVGVTPNSDTQKIIDNYKTYITKGTSDFEAELSKLRTILLKNADPKIAEKIDEYEKDLKKYVTEAKQYIDDKVGKPINDKYKNDIKKVTDQIIKVTKDAESTVNKAIDSQKKN
ncbi:uncharacterized protein LOC126835805 [Adelges cooleyi]|uniref:uncharacterized protein LOC126835805 n=1 Tax=Adelges cooleyi TaxID=133065 RepID=UPI00218051D6|nr:uncharacterized protein LOC126835805 [Adelges cooleyi]